LHFISFFFIKFIKAFGVCKCRKAYFGGGTAEVALAQQLHVVTCEYDHHVTKHIAGATAVLVLLLSV
jgi:hypothetical protein